MQAWLGVLVAAAHWFASVQASRLAVIDTTNAINAHGLYSQVVCKTHELILN
jgi:hypothetical protein